MLIRRSVQLPFVRSSCDIDSSFAFAFGSTNTADRYPFGTTCLQHCSLSPFPPYTKQQQQFKYRTIGAISKLHAKGEGEVV